MLPILVSGGTYPNNWKSIQDSNDENFIRFDTAQLLIIDWHTGNVINEINYTSPEENLNPSMMFKVCEVTETEIIPVTNSEVLVYDKSNLALKNVITHPSFNDLHSVKKIGGKYYVVNTGLEVLQVVSDTGEILKEHNMTTTATWERFSKQIDYRKIGSTKPHDVHFNNVFCVGEEIFVTRLVQKDAVNLREKNDKFVIDVGSPHDGVVHEDKVYFTTTNGHLIIFDGKTRSEERVVDINKLLLASGLKDGGWCRGVLPLTSTKILIGYTQLRHTKFKEFVSWAKKLGDSPARTRILEIDLSENRVTKEFLYPGSKGSALFSINRLD